MKIVGLFYVENLRYFISFHFVKKLFTNKYFDVILNIGLLYL